MERVGLVQLRCLGISIHHVPEIGKRELVGRAAWLRETWISTGVASLVSSVNGSRMLRNKFLWENHLGLLWVEEFGFLYGHLLVLDFEDLLVI